MLPGNANDGAAGEPRERGRRRVGERLRDALGDVRVAIAAEVAGAADEVVLLPVYAARELPIQGVTSDMIAGKMKNKNVQVMDKDAVLQWIKNEYSKRLDGVLVTAGAGDIDTIVEPIKQILS